MADLRTLSSTSNRVRFTLKDKTTGQGKTGLSTSTSGLIISTIADNEASATTYTQASSTIETISTLGTFATPTATKCRFKEVDATNHKGLYEFQFADARFAVSSAKRLVISVNDAGSTILDADYEISFEAVPAKLASDGLSLITNGTYDMKQLLIMVFEAAFYAKISGLPTSPAVLRNFADTVDRATIAFDSNNNRTSVTINNAP